MEIVSEYQVGDYSRVLKFHWTKTAEDNLYDAWRVVFLIKDILPENPNYYMFHHMFWIGQRL